MTRLRFLMTVLGLLAMLACSTTLLLSVGRAELARLGTAPDPARPGRQAPPVLEGLAAPGPSSAPALPAPPLQTAGPARATLGMPSHASLSRKYPQGLLAQAQSTLAANETARAMDLADDLSFCLAFKANGEAMARLGRPQAWPEHSPLSDPAEAARTDAFCQTLGTQGQVLLQQLLRLAAAGGEVRAAVRIHREQWEPGPETARQLGRWAMAGAHPLAFSTVLLDARPAAFGLSEADLNVLRRALALAAETPALGREGFQAILVTTEQAASLEQAGVQGPQAHALWQSGRVPRVKFAELVLPAADEQRARAIVQALVRSVDSLK